MKRILLGLFMLIGMLTLNSCFVAKKVVYVEDMKSDTLYRALQVPELRLQQNDRVSIVISSRTPELAIPFNQESGKSQVSSDDYTSQSAPLIGNGYLLNDMGQIEFPILGTLTLKDLTLEEVKLVIQEKLKSERLINDPIVKVELLNLKINVMGEVLRPGILRISDGKINLLDAISMVGGLTANSKPDRIMVIREENNQRRIIQTNIGSKDIFNSAAYNLKQNDIVYVEPIAGKFTPKEELTFRFLTTGLSILSIVLTGLNLMK